MQNANTWFEIPAADLDRSRRFYEAMLDRTMRGTEPGVGYFAQVEDLDGNLVGLHATA